MNIKKTEMIEEAKSLFLTPDEKGNRKYSLRAIATLLRQKYTCNIHHETIRRWAERYGWMILWEEAIKKGIVAAAVEKEKAKEQRIDEIYKEAIARRKKEDYLLLTEIRNLAIESLRAKKQAGEFLEPQEALKALELALKYSNYDQSVDNELRIIIEMKSRTDD